jgi:hypothetical protein
MGKGRDQGEELLWQLGKAAVHSIPTETQAQENVGLGRPPSAGPFGGTAPSTPSPTPPVTGDQVRLAPVGETGNLQRPISRPWHDGGRVAGFGWSPRWSR